ncbi:hypothetical protein F0562_015486 [Nyssa sinensis]|uniref:Uncharacterized protein n=1 Tax=Nyssa sinensis TaxID=561372 RepID=A0A5J4ZKJ4_9ASTE|nr:hypothetical protein F0562_015486 [Nyssa sinensis]
MEAKVGRFFESIGASSLAGIRSLGAVATSSRLGTWSFIHSMALSMLSLMMEYFLWGFLAREGGGCGRRYHGCEREVAEAANGVSDELKNESIMRLSWALAHSRQVEDVQRGLAMLEASLANTSSPLQKREKLYLLAVGYYRSGEYPRSRQLVEQCLEMYEVR